MITIKEIAGQLKLSTTTVSNVIHGKTKEVSPETIEKVRKFLDEVGYVPNINARNLAQNESKIIGVVLKTTPGRYLELLSDPFVAEMITGIEREIREAGYYMMIYLSESIEEILTRVSTWNVDGLILFWMLDDDGIRVSEKYHKPVVCVDTMVVPDMKHFVNIGLDDADGSYQIVKYMIECGHRKIGFLSDNKMAVDLQRYQGYKRALEEAGIEVSEDDFFLMSSQKNEIEESLEELCDKAKDYTAVFCVSDLFALMFMDHLYDRGIRVPEDISVAGFDDNRYARLHRPALTTVHQEAEGKGVLAARTLISMLKGNEPESNEIILKPELVIRDTVKKI